MNTLKRHWFILLVFSLMTAFFACQTEVTEPQGFADVPECKDKADVSIDVLLVHVAEVHPKRPGSLPGPYEAAIKQLHTIDTTFTISFKESDADIIERVQTPYPDEFMIGKRLNYTITRKPCKDKPTDQPKDPDDKPLPGKNPLTKPRPDSQ